MVVKTVDKKKRRRYTAAEKKAMGLDKMPTTMYGGARAHDPRLLEEAPTDHDPRNRRTDR